MSSSSSSSSVDAGCCCCCCCCFCCDSAWLAAELAAVTAEPRPPMRVFMPLTRELRSRTEACRPETSAPKRARVLDICVSRKAKPSAEKLTTASVVTRR